MKGIRWFSVIAILAWLTGISISLGAAPSPGLIEPGLRVGQIRIGESREAVERALENQRTHQPPFNRTI